MPLCTQFIIPPDKTLTLVKPCFIKSPAALEELVPVLQINITQSSSVALKRESPFTKLLGWILRAPAIEPAPYSAELLRS